jgi:hypothetical protein
MPDQERIQLIIDFANSGKDAKEIREELEKLDATTAKLKGSYKDVGRGVLELSQTFQDFAQGGFGGVLNNLDRLVTLFGGPLGLAAGISAVGVSAKVLYDNWGTLSKALGADSSIQDKVEQLGKLKEAADKAADSLNKQIDALRKSETAGKPEAAEVARAAIQQQGGVDATTNALTSQLLGESPAVASRRQTLLGAQNKVEDMLRKIRAGGIGDARALAEARRQVDEATKELDLVESGVRQQAQGLVVGAGQGDQAAIGELARRFPGGAFNQATPEGLQAADEFVQADLDQADRTRRGARARRRANKLVDDLNRQGQQQEAALGRDQQEADEETRKAIEKAQEGTRKFLEGRFFRDDPRDEQRRTEMRERGDLGREFRDFASGFGQDLNRREVEAAGKDIQRLMEAGYSKDEAAVQTLKKIVDNQRAMSNRFQALQQAYSQIQAEADTVPTLLELGQ